MDYRKKLVVEPGAKVKLKAIDPGYHGKHETRRTPRPTSPRTSRG